FLGNQRPTLQEPLLRRTVMQNRFFYKGEPAIRWLDGNPPPSFEFVGNLPLTKDEVLIEGNVYGGKWDDSSGNEAFLEWRWIHDRAAFEEEVRKGEEERERFRRQAQSPRK